MRNAGAPQHDDQAAKPTTVQSVADDPNDRDDLLDGGRVAGIAGLCCAGHDRVKAGHRPAATTTSGIEDGRSGQGL